MVGDAVLGGTLTGAPSNDITSALVGTATLAGTLETGAGAITSAMAGSATLSGILDSDTGPPTSDFKGNSSREWVQVFDATYTKIRCQIKKTGSVTVTVPQHAHSLTIRRII